MNQSGQWKAWKWNNMIKSRLTTITRKLKARFVDVAFTTFTSSWAQISFRNKEKPWQRFTKLAWQENNGLVKVWKNVSSPSLLLSFSSLLIVSSDGGLPASVGNSRWNTQESTKLPTNHFKDEFFYLVAVFFPCCPLCIHSGSNFPFSHELDILCSKFCS